MGASTELTPEPWPEPPGCPGCGAPNQRGAESCWLCGARLPEAEESGSPQTPVAPSPPEVAGPEGPPPRARRPSRLWPWPRPRVSIATSMIVIGVLAVLLAVGSGKAGIVVGLAVVVGPAVGYLVARARRVERGGERPSTLERALGEVAVTVLIVSAGVAALALVAAVLLGLLQGLSTAL